jgi:arylsulfatase A-like enzyme
MWILATMIACGTSDAPQQASPGPTAAQPQQPPQPPPMQQGPAVQVSPTFELIGDVSERPRSLVLISLDTVRADRLGVYGGRAETPTLDALAARGARFEQAISHFPETALSHWAMLSGVLPELHGNVPANRGSRCTVPTLAEVARKSGLPTAAFIGGVTMTDSASGLSRGFDVYDDQFPLDTRDMRRPGREVTRRAVDWIQRQDRPYFAFVHYFDAHFPYTPAPPWDTRYDPDYTGTLTGSDADLRPYRDGDKAPSPRDVAHILALYDGELSELDALIAPVIAAAGEDAIVMVTADHGESFEHGYYFNHRAGLWDSITRVPWILAGPGIPAGAIVAEQVGLTDVTPTALALMGLPTDARVQGASRAGLLQGSGDGAAVVYATTDPWMHGFQFSARTLERKIIEQDGTGVAVYDLVRDPQEDAPSASGPPHLMAAQGRYQQMIADMKGCQVTLTDAPPMTHSECSRLQALGYIHGDCE